MQYTKEVMDHFRNPRNMGEIKDADGLGEVGNLKCGDMMTVYIKVAKRPKIKNQKLKIKNEEYISDIKFQALGCAAAIAASSMMTELAKGKTLSEAKKITRDDINDSLGQLPKQKYHCSILSASAIKKAIDNYENHMKQDTSNK